MFAALYEFKVKAGKEAEFKKAWAETTDAIARHRGALGSRLHKTETAGVFVAYAQWPSRETYFDDSGQDNFTPDENQARRKMKDATEYIKTVYLMEVVDDRLKKS